MRYTKTESTYILGVFNSGDTVTISIYKLSDDTKIIDEESCSEINSTGIFKYEFFHTVAQKEEFLWIMNNGDYSKYGKIVLGGYLDNLDAQISSRASKEDLDKHDKKMTGFKFI